MTIARIAPVLAPLLAIGVASLAAGTAAASPFCIQMTGFPLQCMFVDPGQCQHEATRLGGICAANPAEFTTPPQGGQEFCVVESGTAATCAFADRSTCSEEAVRKNAACVEATPAKPPIAVDPYQVKRPY